VINQDTPIAVQKPQRQQQKQQPTSKPIHKTQVESYRSYELIELRSRRRTKSIKLDPQPLAWQ